MKIFKPYYNHIEVRPIEKKAIIQQDNNFIEAGEVIALPKDTTYPKVGDIIFFESYGCFKTTDQVDGTIHYLVALNSAIIKGVYGE